ncbi:hypothetical protein ABZ086_34155, partial [Streptomyces halstedii]
VMALREALADGTIDCVATDHAPHPHEDKAGSTMPTQCPGARRAASRTASGTIEASGTANGASCRPSRRSPARLST